MQKIDFVLRGEFITLDRLLKATGVAGSGAQAKQLVAEGRVQVDGQDELRKTAKLHAGQVVAITGTRIRLLPPPAGGADPADVPPADDPMPESRPDSPPPAAPAD